MSYVERKRMDCAALPKGWKREEVIRKSGLSAGKIDVYYYSPNGKKFRSKPQLSRYLGDSVDLSSFDFRTGKLNTLLLRKNKRLRGSHDYSRGVRNDASLIPPIRQTASIFKQPVTVIKTQPGSIVKTDLKHGPQEKPKQVFWEKRLQGLSPCDENEEIIKPMKLPDGLTGKIYAAGPNLQDETLIRSIATALHISTVPVTGQTGSKSSMEKNPGVFINPDQPLIQAVVITDEDIKKQEWRVQEARKRLEDALASFNVTAMARVFLSVWERNPQFNMISVETDNEERPSSEKSIKSELAESLGPSKSSETN